jgi:hypothetical protein
MKKFKGYPKAYQRDPQTKLLYLYKSGIITREQWGKARFFLAMARGINKYGLEGAMEKLNNAIKEAV